MSAIGVLTAVEGGHARDIIHYFPAVRNSHGIERVCVTVDFVMHVRPEHTYITISTSAQQIRGTYSHLKQPFSKMAPDSFHEKAPSICSLHKNIFAYLKQTAIMVQQDIRWIQRFGIYPTGLESDEGTMQNIGVYRHHRLPHVITLHKTQRNGID